jgi:Ca2+/Na+ antiporter
VDNTGMIIGIVIGSVFFVALLVFLIIFCYKKLHSENDGKEELV